LYFSIFANGFHHFADQIISFDSSHLIIIHFDALQISQSMIQRMHNYQALRAHWDARCVILIADQAVGSEGI
jgi:hypothetical protein